MSERSTKPYLIRAIHEWCADSGFTPYLSVRVDQNTRVPMEFVKDGEIVLNLSYDATHKLTIDDTGVQFSARFSGVSRECSVPMGAITGIFSRENGQGLFFTPESAADVPSQPAPDTMGEPETPPPTTPTRPKLQVVK